MNSELEYPIRALLEDPNVPDEAIESALTLILEEWVEGNKDLLSASWSALAHRRLHAFKLLGRPWTTSQKRVRVSRVISLTKFLRYFTKSSALIDMPTAVAAQKLPELTGKDGDVSSLLPRSGLVGDVFPQWVTLQAELRDREPIEILEETGIPRDWVALYSCLFEYTLDSSELRTPTVLDASLGPWFVSKQSHPSEIPRAWNWKQNGWGLPEFVHAPTAKITNPTLRLLSIDRGTLRAHLPEAIELFTGYTQVQPSELEWLVQRILRQVSAHEDLETFIDGSTDLLTLTPNEFESFLDVLYRRQGFKTTLTKASRDGGFDVIALSDPGSKNGLLIQAKKTRRTVGISVIRELIGARFLAPEYGDCVLVIATTGRFSNVARKAEATHPSHIKLRDYRNLQEELRGYAQFRVTDIAKKAKRLRSNVK